MIRRLRQALAAPDLARRLTARAEGLPAAAPASLDLDLGGGGEDWLSLLPEQGDFWYWAQPARDDYRLAIGHAFPLASAGPNRFAALDQGWGGLRRHWRFDTPPAAFLGFAFAETAKETPGPLPNALLAVPSLLLASRQGRCRATLTAPAGTLAQGAALWAALLPEHTAATGCPAPQRLPQPLADRAWLARVHAALRDIEAGRLEKIVLSRSIRLRAASPLPAAPLLAALLRQQPASTIYAHGHRQAVFLGASPERLASLCRGRAEADALAGTAWPGSAQLRGDKNAREQSLVAAAVRAALAPLCNEVSASAAPEALQVGPLSHLRNRIGGTLRAGLGLFDLVRALHPTPAVGGSPSAAASDWLRRHKDERAAWYSGGIGWLDAEGDGEVAVALRCALLAGTEIELQAGAGIVAGSDPEQEFAETEAKLATLLSVLEAPPQLARTGT